VSDIANVDQAELWDGHEGAHWSAHADAYDASLRVHLELLLRAAAISPNESVLDVGCGNGASTLVAARTALPGRAVGVDLSSAMLARARAAAEAEGVANASFVQGDAQVHRFEPDAFDVAISRFGVMFFADPVAAFVNIGRALKPGGRIAWIVWRSLAENEVFSEIRRAISVGRNLPDPAAGAPSPFGLADTDFTERALAASGFVDIGFEPCDAPYFAGADADTAYAYLSALGFTRFATADLDDTDRTHAFDALRATIEAHATEDGVVFDSACWLVSARRPPG
jgi:SAM-dependent methyltransferase